MITVFPQSAERVLTRIYMLRIDPTQDWHDIHQPEGNDEFQRFVRYRSMLQPLIAQKNWQEDGVRSMYTLNKYMDVFGPSKVRPFMSTEDKDNKCDLGHVTPIDFGSHSY